MRYVITGATSFIGMELSGYLLKQGEEVIAVCRPGNDKMHEFPSGISVVESEMSEYGNLCKLISNADVFLHLAWGGTGHDGRNNTEIQKENIAATLDAFKAANAMKCKLFVDAGSQAEYGSTTDTQTEDMVCHPFSEYGKAKLEVNDKCCQLTEQMKGMKYIHLRIFSVFGEHDHQWTLVMSAIGKMLRNEELSLSPCTQNWNFIYSEDLAKIVSGLCNNAISQPEFVHETYNIASNDTRTLKNFLDEMKALCQSDSKLNYGEIKPAVTVSLQPDISKTVKASGFYDFTPFDKTIRKIIASNKSSTYKI